jgi:RimJ/RimL family protein N-acetyltransferase
VPLRGFVDASRYRIREFREDDYPVAARMWTRLVPQQPVTVEDLRTWDRVFAAAPNFVVKRVAEEFPAGNFVGEADLSNSPEMGPLSGFAWGGVGVDPDHQGRGVGLALAAELQREAERRGSVCLWATARSDDERSLRFLAQQGFQARRRSWISVLTLDAAREFPDRSGELAKEGITFTTLAEEGAERSDVLRRVADLFTEAEADAPRMGTFTPPTFEQFLQLNVHRPTILPEAYFLARRGEEYVGMSTLERINAEPDTLWQTFTGTRRSVRGRGVAKELKRRTVEFGRRHGYRKIRTGNDSLNAPMWAINQKLGYQQLLTWVTAEKTMGPPPKSP